MQDENDLCKAGIVRGTKEERRQTQTSPEKKHHLSLHNTFFMLAFYFEFCNFSACSKEITAVASVCAAQHRRSLPWDSVTAVVPGCAGDRLKFYLNTHFVEAEQP